MTRTGASPSRTVSHPARPSRGKLISLLLSAFILRLSYIALTGELGQSPPRDYREFVTAGTRFHEHGTIASPFTFERRVADPSYVLPPAYVVVVGSAYRVFGVESFGATLALQLLNAVATTAVVLFVFQIADVLGGRRPAWIAGVVAAFNPLLFGMTCLIWDTYLFTLGVALAVWLSVKLGRRSPSSLRFFLFGVYLGLLALLNPALTVAYPLLILWPCASSKLRWREMMVFVLTSLLGWMLAIAPWTVRNYHHFHELVYIRGGFMLELWLGACPEAQTNPRGVHDARYPLANAHAQWTIEEFGETEFMRECGRQAKEAIAADPWRFIRLSAMRTIDFWAGTIRTHAHAPNFVWLPRDPKRLAIMVFLTAEALLAFQALVMRGPCGAGRWLAVMALIFSLVYCVTHVELRFRVPIEPLFAVLLGLGWTRLRWRRTAAP